MDPMVLQQILAALQHQQAVLQSQVDAVQAELARLQGAGSPIPPANPPASPATVPYTLSLAARSGPGRPMQQLKCQVPGCTAKHTAKGMCSRHYAEARRAAMRNESK